MPFLEILTRCYKRPKMLAANQASLQQQTSSDYIQTLLIDDVGRGIAWSYINMAAYAPKLAGEYIWILDDDNKVVSLTLVEDLKAIAETHNPDVIMVRRDSGELGILPDGEYWQAAPVVGHVDAGCYIVRREVWQTYANCFGARYAGDFDFINGVFASDPTVYWYDDIASAVQEISNGMPEASHDTYGFGDALPPIVICSTSGKCLLVLAASIEQYVPEGVEVYWSAREPIPITDTRHKWHVLPNTANNFGDAYNAAIQAAIDDGHQSVILCNDDVVLTPNSYAAMLDDLATIHKTGRKVGIVGARSDYVCTSQNIRIGAKRDVFVGNQWKSESYLIKKATRIAPIFAWLSAQAFSQCQLPPINLFSDTVLCQDLIHLGYEHFVSCCYVHHAGSQTIGADIRKLHDESRPWLTEHRPALAREIFVDGNKVPCAVQLINFCGL